MRARNIAPRFGSTALTLTALALASSQALAAEYWLKAGTTTLAMPSSVSVPMWGYANCAAPTAQTDTAAAIGPFESCEPATVPGPALVVPAGDTELKVHLLNTLSAPTSLVINGLFKAMKPVWTDGTSVPRGGDLSKRVRSFDTEAAAGGTQVYTWSNVAPGTYLYQSGTQTQVQVQMGLYGAVTQNAVDAATGVRAQAYAGAANEYDNQVALLYSEIDPALHAAVAAGTYGTTGPTSTFDYQPKYFLINGKPYEHNPQSPTLTMPVGNPGTTLVRLLNAGLTTHVPSVQGKHWDLIGEDGKAYPFKRSQYTALLPAAKTTDALLTPDIGGGSYPILDRRLNLSNNGASNGGMLAVLSYGSAGVSGVPDTGSYASPKAVDDAYGSIPGVELSVGAGQGVLANDTVGTLSPIRAVAASGLTAANGSYSLNANGSFSYIPPLVSAASDSFVYKVTDGKALSGAATVTITLSTPAAPVLTLLDPFDVTPLAAADWTFSSGLTVAAGAVSSSQVAQAVWTRDTVASPTGNLGATQYASLTSADLSKVALILKATGGNTKDAPANFVRVRVEGSSVVVATQVGGANTPVYIQQAAFPAAATSDALTAQIDAKGLVTVYQGGTYLGGVQLPDVGAWKGSGRIGIQFQAGGSADSFSGGAL
jgi:FtsP/CotA-like multicopper oxidase with cupredoxin domain